MDIADIPMRRGLVYLTAVVDVASRRVLAHRVPNTTEAAFCVEALEDAAAHHRRPEIFDTDQGSQFIGLEFTGVLSTADVSNSMDGKGTWRGHVFVERIWRSIEYGEVYPKADDNVSDARKSISSHIGFYNSGRPHSRLDGRTPDEAYFVARRLARAA